MDNLRYAITYIKNPSFNNSVLLRNIEGDWSWGKSTLMACGAILEPLGLIHKPLSIGLIAYAAAFFAEFDLTFIPRRTILACIVPYIGSVVASCISSFVFDILFAWQFKEVLKRDELVSLTRDGLLRLAYQPEIPVDMREACKLELGQRALKRGKFYDTSSFLTELMEALPTIPVDCVRIVQEYHYTYSTETVIGCLKVLSPPPYAFYKEIISLLHACVLQAARNGCHHEARQMLLEMHPNATSVRTTVFKDLFNYYKTNNNITELLEVMLMAKKHSFCVDMQGHLNDMFVSHSDKLTSKDTEILLKLMTLLAKDLIHTIYILGERTCTSGTDISEYAERGFNKLIQILGKQPEVLKRILRLIVNYRKHREQLDAGDVQLFEECMSCFPQQAINNSY